MYRFKVTILQQLLVFSHAVISILLVICVSYIIWGSPLNNPIARNTLLILLIIDTLPAAILHIQYLYENQNLELLVNYNDNTIVIKNKKSIITYSLTEISSLQLFISFGRNTGFYSFAIYRYYKITFSDGYQVFVTCLMINDIEKTLKKTLHVNEEVKNVFFCNLPLSRSQNEI